MIGEKKGLNVINSVHQCGAQVAIWEFFWNPSCMVGLSMDHFQRQFQK